MKKKILALTILIALTILPAAAQTLPSQPSKEEQKKAQEELERKTLILLDEVVSDSLMLKLVENRAIIQASAADLLWVRDEKRARTLFRDALMALGDTMAGVNPRDSSQVQTYWMSVRLRQQLLRMVARRDPQLALDLLQATRPTAAGDTPQGFGIPEQELMLEQTLAAEVAANDPKRALKMAEDSLAKGISYSLLSVLNQLQQKDAELAQRFATDIIKKLQTENLAQNQMAMFVAQDLLRNILRPPGPSLSMVDNQGSGKAKPLSFDDQTKRDLVDIVTRAAISGPSDNPALVSLQFLMSDVEKLVPERAQQLRKRIAEAQKTLDPQMRSWMEFEPLMSNGTTDAILEAAAKAPPEMRSALYSSAAWKLVQSGDVERARQIVNDNLSGPEREQMLAQIDQRLVARAIEQGKVDEAKQLISRIRSKNGRAVQFAVLALKLANKGERKIASELLDETKTLINREPDNQEEITTLLLVARAYAAVEPARAFELIEPLVDQANEMVSAAALLSKFNAGQGLFRKGEMVLQPGFTTANTMFSQYGKELGALARADFNRTKAIADRLQRNEVRLMARLFIAQSVLSDRLGSGDETDGSPGIIFAGGSTITVSEN